MRRSFAAGLAALTLLLLAGCGGSKASPSEVPEQPSEEPAPPEPTAEELAALPTDAGAIPGADWYLVDKDFTWTYVQTHEADCGPYFCRRDPSLSVSG